MPAVTAQSSPGTAIVPSAPLGAKAPEIPPGSPALRLPVELEVSVPVKDFRVRKLLALEAGSLVESRWKHGEDLPLSAGRVQLAWTEFELVETQLAARLTRLA
jgi:flagellar motor switch protein FliN/FliY